MKRFFLLLLVFSSVLSPAFSQVRTGIIASSIQSGSGCIATDVDACTYLAATGITDPTITGAVDDLVIAAKAHGWWSLCIAIYPFVGGTSATNAVNLKTPGTFDISWTGSVTHNSSGITGDGSSGYGDTHINGATSLSQNSVHASCWIGTNVAEDKTDFGYTDASVTQILQVYSRNASGNAVGRNGSYPASEIAVANASSVGFYLSNRSASNSSILYKNASSIGSNAAASAAMVSFNMYLLALNYTGGPIQFSSKNMQFFTIGTSVNSTIEGDMYNDISAFQIALGR